MPKPELLETFDNPYPGRDYEISMECPEFTSLCPLGGIETDATELKQLEGGAPDFGTILIAYVPDQLCLELKSLKLYLWSFRNDGIFYERAVNRILDDLSRACRPRWMEVTGDFNIRGGIKSVITAVVTANHRDTVRGEAERGSEKKRKTGEKGAAGGGRAREAR
jgi:7-cyano-7-deazaguanine reductase